MVMFINFLFGLVLLPNGFALSTVQDANSNVSLQPSQDGDVCTPGLDKILCGLVFQLTDKNGGKNGGKTADLYIYTAKCIQISSFTNINNFNLASSLSKSIIITSTRLDEGPSGPPVYDISLTYDGYRYGPTTINLPDFALLALMVTRVWNSDLLAKHTTDGLY